MTSSHRRNTPFVLFSWNFRVRIFVMCHENRIRHRRKFVPLNLQLHNFFYNVCVYWTTKRNTCPNKNLMCSCCLNDWFLRHSRRREGRRKSTELCSNCRWSSCQRWVTLIYWQRFKASEKNKSWISKCKVVENFQDGKLYSRRGSVKERSKIKLEKGSE